MVDSTGLSVGQLYPLLYELKSQLSVFIDESTDSTIDDPSDQKPLQGLIAKLFGLPKADLQTLDMTPESLSVYANQLNTIMDQMVQFTGIDPKSLVQFTQQTQNFVARLRHATLTEDEGDVVFPYQFQLVPRTDVDDFERVYRSRTLQRQNWSLKDSLANARKIDAIGISNNEIALHLDRAAFRESLEQGTVYRILMLDPDSKATQQREIEENVSIGSISTQTIFAIRNLLLFRQELPDDLKKRIILKLYDFPPRFNMTIINGNYLVLQVYASFTRGRNNPVYVLRRTREDGMVDFYQDVFEQTFEEARDIPNALLSN